MDAWENGCMDECDKLLFDVKNGGIYSGEEGTRKL